MLKHILAAVQKHAVTEYPRERCGVIVGSGKAWQYARRRNTANQPQEEFRMHPEDYAAVEDLGEVVATVYSHPDATSRSPPHDPVMCEASGLSRHILSWLEGDLWTIVPAGNIPPLGRPSAYGAWDCWQVYVGWYQRERGIEFPYFEHFDGWWERADGPSPCEQQFEAAGFVRVEWPQRGDMIVMEVGRTAHPNYVGIYLGDGPSLPGEETKVFGAGPFLLHHLYEKPSEIIVYGGNWHEWARLVLRHRQVRQQVVLTSGDLQGGNHEEVDWGGRVDGDGRAFVDEWVVTGAALLVASQHQRG